MKIASFEIDGRETIGIVSDASVREVSRGFRERYSNLCAVLAADALALLYADKGAAEYALQDVRFLPTIPRPEKILCVGVNYRPHAEEMHRELPDVPLLFVRFAASQVGHRQRIVRPIASTKYDFEGELAVVIGRSARHVVRESALNHVAGYTCFMDGTVRDWQRHTTQFTPGKNFDRSGSMGPYLVTRDEIGDPSALRLTTRVNGEIVQEGVLDELVFDIPTLIEYCSTFTELRAGDVIATGTPAGVGAGRKPPVWLQAGDHVAVDVRGVGTLENVVVDEQTEKLVAQ